MTRIYGYIICDKCGESYGSFTYNGGPVRIKSGLCASCKVNKYMEANSDDEKRKS